MTTKTGATTLLLHCPKMSNVTWHSFAVVGQFLPTSLAAHAVVFPAVVGCIAVVGKQERDVSSCQHTIV